MATEAYKDRILMRSKSSNFRNRSISRKNRAMSSKNLVNPEVPSMAKAIESKS